MPNTKKQVGESLDLSSKELDELSEILPQDILDAQAWANQNGTPEFKLFVNARPWKSKVSE